MSLFNFYAAHNVTPLSGDEVKFPCGVTKKVIAVKGNYIMAKPTVTCEDCMDLSKAKLFRDGREVLRRINGAPRHD